MAPKMAISTAPVQTRIVPPKDQRVNGSPRMRVAQIELKTRPDCGRSANDETSRRGATPYCLQC